MTAACQLWVKGRRGQQAGGTAGEPPASEITVRPGTWAWCQKETHISWHALSNRVLNPNIWLYINREILF